MTTREFLNASRLAKRFLKRLLCLNTAGQHLTILSDDIFLVSYPRSGNTWMRFLLSNLIFKAKVDFNNMEKYIPDIYRNYDKYMLRFPRPRLLKSHEVYDQRYPKVIYIIRDGRDVAVSYYYYHKKFLNYSKCFDTFMLEFILGKLGRFGTWSSNILSWVENGDRVKNGFFLLKYEDMLKDINKVIENLSLFLDLKSTEEEINRAINRSSFMDMRQNEIKMEEKIRFLKDSNKQIKFIRIGKQGSWTEIFTSYSKKLFKKNFGFLLIELGYEESFDW